MSQFTDLLGLFHRSAAPVIANADATPIVELAKAKEQATAAATPEELQLTDAALQLIERDEGDRLTAYQDVVGVWTIGYGHTGPDVTPGLTITEEQAQVLLKGDLHRFEEDVNDRVVGGAPTSDNQFSAMVSLSYNVGSGNFAKSSVLRLHRAGQYQQAADAFLLWDKAGGQVYAGLARRRGEERALYLS